MAYIETAAVIQGNHPSIVQEFIHEFGEGWFHITDWYDLDSVRPIVGAIEEKAGGFHWVDLHISKDDLEAIVQAIRDDAAWYRSKGVPIPTRKRPEAIVFDHRSLWALSEDELADSLRFLKIGGEVEIAESDEETIALMGDLSQMGQDTLFFQVFTRFYPEEALRTLRQRYGISVPLSKVPPRMTQNLKAEFSVPMPNTLEELLQAEDEIPLKVAEAKSNRVQHLEAWARLKSFPKEWSPRRKD